MFWDTFIRIIMVDTYLNGSKFLRSVIRNVIILYFWGNGILVLPSAKMYGSYAHAGVIDVISIKIQAQYVYGMKIRIM